MIIICEGVDGAGKTTLVQQLVEAHRGPSRIVKRSQLMGDPMIEYEWRDLREYDGRELLICDRWHVGEMIYGPLYRGKSALEAHQAAHVEMALDALGALKLHVTAPYDVITQRLKERGEDFLQPDHVGIVWDFFNDYAAMTTGWETINTSRDIDVSQLLRWARMRSSAMRAVTAKSYAGPLRPEVLVIVSSRWRSPQMPAFRFAATPHRCDARAQMIMRQIEVVRHHRPVGVMAVADGDDLRATWHQLGQPKIFAVDRHAQTTAEVTGLESHPTPAASLAERTMR